MRLAGRERETARHRDDLGAGESQAAIEFGEAQVVTDAKPDCAARRVCRDDLAARELDVGLLDRHAARQIDVEEMDFAIDGHMSAVGADQHGRVVALGLAGRVLGYRAGDDMQAELAGQARNRRQRFALERFGGGRLL